MPNNRKKIEQAIKLGSKTAKGGFRNEKDVIRRFNNWRKDIIAQAWLKDMNYSVENIESVKATKVRGQYKADIQVTILIVIKLKSQSDVQNLQVKLVSNPQGFNQIDKRWVKDYENMWDIPKNISDSLKYFTGEKKPTKKTSDSRRMNFSEMSGRDQRSVIDFFKANKILVVSDIIKGRGEFSADWMLVILKLKSQETKWVLKSINEAMNVFGAGDVRITEKGSLKIGKIGMQRKGGDGGRETAKMLQFKINPVALFNE